MDNSGEYTVPRGGVILWPAGVAVPSGWCAAGDSLPADGTAAATADVIGQSTVPLFAYSEGGSIESHILIMKL